MTTLRFTSALTGAALSLALVAGSAPASLADPPGYYFQDFDTPQATAQLIGTRLAANHNSASAKSGAPRDSQYAMASGNAQSASEPAGAK